MTGHIRLEMKVQPKVTWSNLAQGCREDVAKCQVEILQYAFCSSWIIVPHCVKILAYMTDRYYTPAAIELVKIYTCTCNGRGKVVSNFGIRNIHVYTM